MRDVLLICMPFGPVFNPALGLSLLQAGLARHHISCRVRYFTIDFAERIGQNFYCDVAYDKGPPVEYLAGESISPAPLRTPFLRTTTPTSMTSCSIALAPSGTMSRARRPSSG